MNKVCAQMTHSEFRHALARVLVHAAGGGLEKEPMSRFSYVRYDETRAAAQSIFKKAVEEVEKHIVCLLPEGRAQELALQRLEETYMWVGKALRDEQIAVDGKVVEEPHRGEVKK